MNIDIDSIFNNLIAAAIWSTVSYLFISVKERKLYWIDLSATNIYRIIAYSFTILFLYQFLGYMDWLPSNNSSYLQYIENNRNISGLSNFYRMVLDIGEANSAAFLAYIIIFYFQSSITRTKKDKEKTFPLIWRVLLGNFGLYLILLFAIVSYVSFIKNDLTFWKGLTHFFMFLFGFFMFGFYFYKFD